MNILISCFVLLLFAGTGLQYAVSGPKLSLDTSVYLKAHLDSKCFIFYSTGTTTKVGLRNNCDDCKVAVINTINRGKSTIEKHRVEGKSQIEIPTAETRQILDDESCPK